MTSGGRPSEPGVLYLVSVPIGHLDDLTLRAIRTLREADLIASEDPAATRLLLSHHDIDTALTSYGPANLKEKVAVLLQRLRQGAHIALVSDCGSPVIDDPGRLLVDAAHHHGIRVVPVPGPSALTAAVAASGRALDSFLFLGTLPETGSGIRRCLLTWQRTRVPAVAFCTPTLLERALHAIAEITPLAPLVLACNLTKPEEVIMRGTARQLRRRLAQAFPVLDVTLILSGGRTAGKKRGGKKRK